MYASTALVTGASRGIGLALARAFAKRGTRVVLVARDADALDAATRAIEHEGGHARAVVADVENVATWVPRLRALDEETGGFETIVANAGVGATSPDATPYAWETMHHALTTNFVGAAATLTALLPAMVARGRGHLLATGSLASYGPLPGSAAYCAPKAGIDMLLECLRLDLRGTGVHVTNLRIGFVRTRMVEKSTHPMPQLLEADEVAERIAREMGAKPAEIVVPRALGWGARALGALPRAWRSRLFAAVGDRG
jgi:short-subunit dehydrogenase